MRVALIIFAHFYCDVFFEEYSDMQAQTDAKACCHADLGLIQD